MPRTSGKRESNRRKPRASTPRIPSGLSSMSPHEAALALAKCHIYVLPGKPGDPSPGALVGNDWQNQSSIDPDVINGWFNEWPDAIVFIHAGPSRLLIFDLDVDDLELVPEPYRSALRKAKKQSSRRGSDRGHYVFRLRPGERYSNSPGGFAGFGEVRGWNGVIRAAPSDHLKGGRYFWPFPGLIPLLPDVLRELLKEAAEHEPAMPDEKLHAFLSEHTREDRPHKLKGVLATFEREVREGSSRHGALVDALCFAFREAIVGFYPAQRAYDEVGAAFLAAFEAPTTAVGRRNRPGPGEAAGAAAWAASQALAADPAETLARADQADVDALAQEVEREKRRLHIRDRAREEYATERAALLLEEHTSRVLDGAEFLTGSVDAAPVWGSGSLALWAQDEAALIVGPQGVGKSSVAQQIVMRRIGLCDDLLFGFPVEVDERPVLYLAMDRPAQIQRSMLRMIDTEDATALAIVQKRLRVHRGPLPFNPAEAPELFAEWVVQAGDDPGTVVVDSYKDLASGLSEDATGAGINSAVQRVLARGIQWLGLHHQRKAQATNAKPNRLDDVYGSGWLTAGVGSVLLLWGEPGATTVELSHLKQPADRVGPLMIDHAHADGASVSTEPRDRLIQLAEVAGASGITEAEVAEGVYGSAKQSDRKRARRLLDRLTDEGLLDFTEGVKGGPGGGGNAARWRWVA
jgi:KaiC/GvpD/RAD55 family RecA-like ATPase